MAVHQKPSPRSGQGSRTWSLRAPRSWRGHPENGLGRFGREPTESSGQSLPVFGCLQSQESRKTGACPIWGKWEHYKSLTPCWSVQRKASLVDQQPAATCCLGLGWRPKSSNRRPSPLGPALGSAHGKVRCASFSVALSFHLKVMTMSAW